MRVAAARSRCGWCTRTATTQTSIGGGYRASWRLTYQPYRSHRVSGWQPRRVVEEIIAPLSSAEAAWRESLRDGPIETFFVSYPHSKLPDYDDRVGFHDDERLRPVRERPHKFAR